MIWIDPNRNNRRFPTLQQQQQQSSWPVRFRAVRFRAHLRTTGRPLVVAGGGQRNDLSSLLAATSETGSRHRRRRPAKQLPLLKQAQAGYHTTNTLLLLYRYQLFCWLSIVKPRLVFFCLFVCSFFMCFCCIKYYNICRLYVLMVVENSGAR